MYCTKKRVQNTSADFSESLIIPSPFKDYVNKWTTEETTTTGRQAYCFHGDLYYAEEDFYCESCGQAMEKHDKYAMPVGTVDLDNQEAEDAFYAFVRQEGLKALGS